MIHTTTKVNTIIMIVAAEIDKKTSMMIVIAKSGIEMTTTMIG
ncbi:hypothetical protein [Neobacillus niacini]|nr:hypothetical protein [Neobacillus niacini]